MSIWLVSFWVHSNGTSKLPPSHFLTEHTKTSGMPEVVSGSSITVDPLDLIIFLMPSRAQMTPTKLMEMKYNRLLHVSTDYKRLGEWLIVDCEGAGNLAKSAHVFS